MKTYRAPERVPSYEDRKKDKIKKPHIYFALDKVFSAYALLLALGFSVVLVVIAVRCKIHIRTLFLFWVFLTYLALPRFHRLLTMMYLPDYFIARTKTGDGILGDPVNMAFKGSEEDIRAAFENAGFFEAEPITLKSGLGIIKSTFFKTSYPEAPVSSLYLFDRKQDMAFQKEVSGSAMKRHHIRFWHVPEGWTLPGGVEADYLAAGTFDRGIGLSTATLQVTHRIDDDIDRERDFIIESLMYTDRKISVSVIENFQTAFHDKNGGGDPVHTDGDMPIINLSGVFKRAPVMLKEPQPDKGLNKELPPASFTFAGMFLLLKLVFTGIMTVYFALGGDKIEKNSYYSLLLMVALYEFAFLMYILATRKYKWSRLILLGITLLSTTFEMIRLAVYGAETFTDILSCTLSVALVLILSSPDIRQWIYEVPGRSGKNAGK